MTYQQERDQFVADAAAAGMALSDARLFMRYATTSHRLAEASCNGDWPADNGERKTKECTTCGSHWAPSFIRKDGLCGDCALDNRIKALAAQYPQFELEQQGDPRGAPIKLHYQKHGYPSTLYPPTRGR